MITLAEIADKTLLPDGPMTAAIAIGVLSLMLGVLLSVFAQRARWLAFVPAAIFICIWHLEWTEFGPHIVREFGRHFMPWLYGLTLALQLPALLFVGVWPRRWSKGRVYTVGCTACGYDMRGLGAMSCPECGGY